MSQSVRRRKFTFIQQNPSNGLDFLLKKSYMKKNMGNSDRVIRIALAVVFGVLYFTGTVTGTFGYVLLGLGAVFILTSLVSSCPLYSLIGLNTCPPKKA